MILAALLAPQNLVEKLELLSVFKLRPDLLDHAPDWISTLVRVASLPSPATQVFAPATVHTTEELAYPVPLKEWLEGTPLSARFGTLSEGKKEDLNSLTCRGTRLSHPRKL